jgi:hypothetical protein
MIARSSCSLETTCLNISRALPFELWFGGSAAARHCVRVEARRFDLARAFEGWAAASNALMALLHDEVMQWTHGGLMGSAAGAAHHRGYGVLQPGAHGCLRFPHLHNAKSVCRFGRGVGNETLGYRSFASTSAIMLS